VLFGQTLMNLRNADTGFEREHLLFASVSPSAYPPERQRAFYAGLLEKVRAVPGVVDAALASDEPLSTDTGWTLHVPGEDAAAAAGAGLSADVSFVSRTYFNTLGIPLIAGQPIEPSPSLAEPWHVLVNQTFVRQYLGSRNPIGFLLTGNGRMTFEIIGVARDNASSGLRRRPEPLMYVALEQRGVGGNLVLYVRSTVAPASLEATIESLIHRDDPGVPIRNMRTIEEHVDRVIGRERTFANLSSSFGLLALLLSAIGLHGMLAYAVSRRTRELGVRLALGASPQRLVRMVLRDAGQLIVFGLASGVPLAFLLGGTIRSLLYGVQPTDWRSLFIAASILATVGLFAAWLPARRAAGVDPLVALRHE
jgi:predicted permease